MFLRSSAASLGGYFCDKEKNGGFLWGTQKYLMINDIGSDKAFKQYYVSTT